MKGTVIRRGNKWSVVVETGRGPDGKRIRKWHSGYATKKEAEQERIDLLSRLQRGLYVAPSKVTLAEYLRDHWLPAKEATLAATSFDTYTDDVEKRIIPALGARKLQQLTPAEIQAFYRDLGERLAAKTIRNVHAVLHRALEDALRWDLVARNVADAVDPPKATRPEIMTWTATEVRTFLEATSEERLSAVWALMATTGMRRSEVLGLRWRNVDLDARRLAVVDSLVSVKSRPTLRLGETKTTGSRRTIALDAGTTMLLRGHRTRQLEERLSAGSAWQDFGLVFAREDGSLLSPDWVTRTFQSIAKANGLEPIGPHGLRHTWATLALQANVPAKVVSERLGHSTVGLTLDRYSHVLPTMQEDAAETISRAIYGV